MCIRDSISVGHISAGTYLCEDISMRKQIDSVTSVRGHISAGTHQYWDISVRGRVSVGTHRYWDISVRERVSVGTHQYWDISVWGHVSVYPFMLGFSFPFFCASTENGLSSVRLRHAQQGLNQLQLRTSA